MRVGPEDLITDTGPRGVGTRVRCCAVSRSLQPVGDLIRFVVSPDGMVLADLKRKLPGRGLWVTARRSTVREAVRRQAFARGFRREVAVAPDLAERVETQLTQAALDALAIAAKASRVVSGFVAVNAALTQRDVAALLHAKEAAPDGIRKLAAAWARRPAGARAVVSLFTSPQLDLALGRSNVIHAALLPGRESDGFLMRCASLERFRSDDGGAPARP
jgi:uncharacterized protein